VTNNASRTPQQIVAHLGELGVPAQPDEVVTSAHAAATLAVERLGPGGRVFVVGGDGLRDAVAGVGLVLVERYDAVPAPQMVVQGFSPDLRYEDLAQAALAVAAGADWVATNADATLPTSRGLQPGNGTLVAAVAAAAGRQPVVAGKPERALVEEAVRRSGAQHPLMVGDRLDTDIAGAVRAELDSLLVLTGVSTVADLLAAAPAARPTYVGASLAALGAAQTPIADFGTLPTQRRTGWQAETWPGSLRLTRTGAGPADPLDAVRTLIAAAWAGLDAGEPVTRVAVDSALEASLLAAGVPGELFPATPAPDAGPSTTLAGDARAGR
jgi:glycerol 3-phosphatase-2